MKKKIDLMQLKILGLLLCEGEEVEKADILFDVMFGQGIYNAGYKYKMRDKYKITWKNPRLIETVKKLIYFSEVFPKKYLEYFIPDTSHLLEKDLECESNNYSFRS